MSEFGEPTLLPACKNWLSAMRVSAKLHRHGSADVHDVAVYGRTERRFGRSAYHRLFLLIALRIIVPTGRIYCPTRRPYARYTIPVFTAVSREHGPWTRASFLETREHGPSRSAGAIVNDVIIIFYLQDWCSK